MCYSLQAEVEDAGVEFVVALVLEQLVEPAAVLHLVEQSGLRSLRMNLAQTLLRWRTSPAASVVTG